MDYNKNILLYPRMKNQLLVTRTVVESSDLQSRQLSQVLLSKSGRGAILLEADIKQLVWCRSGILIAFIP